MTQLLKMEQVAEQLQVEKRTVYEWIRTGKLAGIKAGGRWRVDPKDLAEFITSQDKKQSEG